MTDIVKQGSLLVYPPTRTRYPVPAGIPSADQAKLDGLIPGTYTVGYWDDLRVPATSTKLGGAKDPGFAVFLTNGTGSQGVFIYWFDKAAEEDIFFTCQLPHSYDEGTNIVPHVHWVPKVNGASGAKVSWGLEYTWANTGGVFGNTNIIYANAHTPADAVPLASKHYMTSFAALTGTSKTISSMPLGRLFRDATSAGKTDDYDDDAGLLEIDFHFQKDSTGSASEASK